MRRTDSKLADGREIFFYDLSDKFGRVVDDRRDLEPYDPHPELRHDVLRDEWVGFATHRQHRTHLPPSDECPLCPSRDGRLTEVPTAGYDVVVFENRFPSYAAGPRSLRGRLFHQRPRRVVRRVEPRAGAAGGGGVGRPHGRAFGAAGRRAGVLLREPGRGDRGHAAPSAWADLRLPVRHAADAGDAGCRTAARGADRRQPVRRTAKGGAGRGRTGGGAQRTLDGVRAVCRALPGRGAPLPAPPGARPASVRRRRA